RLTFLLLLIACLESPMPALSWWDMTPQEVREAINGRVAATEAETVEVFSVTEQNVPYASKTIPVRMYRPSDEESLPYVLLIHGGAFVAGNLDTHDNLARFICSRAQVVVISVGYHNAPESRFPSQLEECYHVLQWVHENK